MAMAMRQRKKPSRMVLSSDVGLSSEQERKRRAMPSPFGGMNQREARIPVRREAPRVTRARAAIPRPSTSDGTEVKRTREKSTTRKDDREPFHALKMQQTLTPLSYNRRGAIKEMLDSIQSFEQFSLLPDVSSAIYTQALAGMTDLVPTPVQKLAIPALLSKKGEFEKSKKRIADGTPKFDQFLLAAETGSGKTLAYLLPVIDAIKRQEERDKVIDAEQKDEEAKKKFEKSDGLGLYDLEAPDMEARHSNMGRPRALLLLPSSELVAQVGKVVKLMGHTIKYKSAAISSNLSPTVIRNRLFNPNGIDIVSTPHLLSSIAEKDPNILSRVTHIVVDEADSLLDRSFSSTTISIIDRATPTLKQLILCSATIPRSLDTFLDKRFPTIKRLVTPKLHSIPRRVQLGVVDIDKAPYNGQRQLACADVIWQIGKSVHDDASSHHTVKCMLVFVNEREQAEQLAAYLASKGIEAVPLTRDTPEARQSEILSVFTERTAVEGEEKTQEKDAKGRTFRDFVPFTETPSSPMASSGPRPSNKMLPNTKVLVTTDLGSRGIDTLAVRHVILYDVPHTTIDFVHRLGRTGRMGRRGRGIVLVGKHDRKDIVREVKEAMFKGQALI
jgi:ATP-dependent RNA helicase MRH4